MRADNKNDGVLIFNGKKYAVGLLWLLVNEDDDKKLARHRVRKAQGDFYCLRSSIVNQHGIGWLDKGHRAGMTAIASIAVDKMVGDWHGVFKADNGWWYLQVHSDTVSPHGDQFFASEEDAYNAFMEGADNHNWPHAYAPKEWDLDIEEIDLSDLIGDWKNGAVLQATSLTSFFGSTKNLQLATLAFVICVLGVFAYFLMPVLFPKPIKVPEKPKIEKKLSAYSQLPKEVAALPDLSQPEEEKIIQLPRPSVLIDTCGQTAGQIIRPIPGWPLVMMTCSPSGVTVEWQKTVGSMNIARNYMKDFPSSARVSIKGRSLLASMPLKELSLFQQENWLSNEQAIFNLEQRLNNIGRLKIKPVTPKPPPPPKKGERPKLPERPYIEIELKTTVSPKTLAGYFDLVGMEVQKITWDVDKGDWMYKAKIMTKRKGE